MTMDEDTKDQVAGCLGTAGIAAVIVWMVLGVTTCLQGDSACEDVEVERYCECREEMDGPLWWWRWHCEGDDG